LAQRGEFMAHVAADGSLMAIKSDEKRQFM